MGLLFGRWGPDVISSSAEYGSMWRNRESGLTHWSSSISAPTKNMTIACSPCQVWAWAKFPSLTKIAANSCTDPQVPPDNYIHFNVLDWNQTAFLLPRHTFIIVEDMLWSLASLTLYLTFWVINQFTSHNLFIILISSLMEMLSTTTCVPRLETLKWPNFKMYLHQNHTNIQNL